MSADSDVAIEAQVEWITSLIKEGQTETSPVIEATHEGEQRWSKLCEELAANSLFWRAEDNWIFGMWPRPDPHPPEIFETDRVVLIVV